MFSLSINTFEKGFEKRNHFITYWPKAFSSDTPQSNNVKGLGFQLLEFDFTYCYNLFTVPSLQLVCVGYSSAVAHLMYKVKDSDFEPRSGRLFSRTLYLISLKIRLPLNLNVQ